MYARGFSPSIPFPGPLRQEKITISKNLKTTLKYFFFIF
jgi:hypothetical protein